MWSAWERPEVQLSWATCSPMGVDAAWGTHEPTKGPSCLRDGLLANRLKSQWKELGLQPS